MLSWLEPKSLTEKSWQL